MVLKKASNCFTVYRVMILVRPNIDLAFRSTMLIVFKCCIQKVFSVIILLMNDV
ncbi:hypothetical protein ACJX0J_009492, partial [Zea mays]